jgi:hypothetical protein
MFKTTNMAAMPNFEAIAGKFNAVGIFETNTRNGLTKLYIY